jgi:hypothetical protein
MESERHAFMRKLLQLCVDTGINIVANEEMGVVRHDQEIGGADDWIDDLTIILEEKRAFGWWDGEKHEVWL